MSVQQDHAVRAAAGAGPADPLRLRHLVPLAVLVVACASVYALTVVAAYLANGLDAVPLSEVGSGAHDPGDLPFPPSGTAAALGYLAVLLTPFVSGAGALFVGVDVVDSLRAGRPWRAWLPSLAVLVLCVVVFAAYVALGQLTAWWLD